MKLLIQDYLSTHSVAELETVFAISARRHTEFPSLVMLKYSQINSPMADPQRQIESQKDFALAIKTSRCSSALFALRNGKAASLRDYFASATQQAVERAVGISTENP